MQMTYTRKRINNKNNPLAVAKLTSLAFSLAALALLALAAASASAQVTFEPPTEFTGAGYAARVAADGQNVVEVYQLDSGLSPLKYRTGKVTTGGTVTWNPVHTYDTGLAPTVALSGANVIEMHEGGGGDLWYHTGKLQASGVITWAPAIFFSNGYAPSVAASGIEIIDVHQATESNPTGLWFDLAEFNSDGTIAFVHTAQYDNGFAPSVALGGATLVEVHQGISPDLWYRDGTIQAGGSSIVFSNAVHFDNGWAPTIAIAGPTIMEAHQGAAGTSPVALWYGTGLLQNSPAGVGVAGGAIKWGNDGHYQTGNLPSIAIAGPVVVEVHEGNTGTIWNTPGQF